MISQESLFASLPSGDRLHLRHIVKDPEGPPVFMLHGSIENGRIFYSENGKGLGPYLAGLGYDVFVGDLRGRGKSHPAIGRRSSYGQTESIIEDIPAFVNEIARRKKGLPQYWIAHSWGGVLLYSFLARFPEYRKLCRSTILFGTKRCIRIFNFQKFVNIDLLWNHVARLLIALFGYLPAKKFRFGADNETDRSHLHCKLWVKPSPWADPQDLFPYGEKIRNLDLPPTLYLAGAADGYLGHPSDVHDFMTEVGPEGACYVLLSREKGFSRDYGHADMLTHPEAVREVYPLVTEWMQGIRS